MSIPNNKKLLGAPGLTRSKLLETRNNWNEIETINSQFLCRNRGMASRTAPLEGFFSCGGAAPAAAPVAAPVASAVTCSVPCSTTMPVLQGMTSAPSVPSYGTTTSSAFTPYTTPPTYTTLGSYAPQAICQAIVRDTTVLFVCETSGKDLSSFRHRLLRMSAMQLLQDPLHIPCVLQATFFISSHFFDLLSFTKRSCLYQTFLHTFQHIMNFCEIIRDMPGVYNGQLQTPSYQPSYRVIG